MELGIIEYIKVIISILALLVAPVGYLYKKLDKRIDGHDTKFDNLEDRMASNETTVEVVKVHLQHMNEKIDKIEKGVDRLLNRNG